VNPTNTPASSPAKSASAAWTAAVIVIVLCLIATFTLRTPSSNGAASGNGRNVSAGGSGGGDGSGGDQSSDGSSGGGSAGQDIAGAAGSNSSGGSGGGTGTSGGSGGRAGTGGSAGTNGSSGTNGTINVAGADCAHGKNGGWHGETGVTPTEIRFAATTATSGVASSFLGDAQYGIDAVLNKVNHAGGICGRQVTVQYKDDSWDGGQGGRYISGFIGEGKYFGLAVNPSSEGLRSAIESKAIDSAKFPVVGSDGMLRDQYNDPWVWPVATSTSSVMHIMVANAIARGAKTFGIVWDKKYRFGQEGRDAFVGELTRAHLTKNSEQGVDGAQGDFSNQAKQFVDDCGGTSFSKCDFVAMLLEPAAADSWVEKDGGLGDGSQQPAYGIGVPQPLFVNSFVHNCGGLCKKMWAWTSFNPPISPFDSQPAVITYKSDLAAVNSSADANNPHVEGAYVGAKLLVDALTKLGAAPTRDGIRQILDNETFDTGLTPSPIVFKPLGQGGGHNGSISARAFEDLVQGNSFANWRYTNILLSDSDVGKDDNGS
jgi:ABC-type branched-subunit amino acid transport system substrate-binding protein